MRQAAAKNRSTGAESHPGSGAKTHPVEGATKVRFCTIRPRCDSAPSIYISARFRFVSTRPAALSAIVSAVSVAARSRRARPCSVSHRRLVHGRIAHLESLPKKSGGLFPALVVLERLSGDRP